MALTEAKWRKGAQLADMLDFVIERGASDRKLRLYAVACSRRSRHRFANPEEATEELHVTDIAERFADGRATAKQLAAVYHCRLDKNATWIVAEPEASNAATSYSQADRMDCKQSEKAALLRDLFGNPFREVTFDPAWRTPLVASLAQAAYDERVMPKGDLDPVRLAILADALEEGGCTDESVLAHLRSTDFHARGCWAVDLCLGKQ